MEMAERFQKAYQHLYNTGAVHSKKELAELMGVARGSVQNAYAGEESYLTESFIRKFAGTFSGTFNVDWLLYGEGEMLAQQTPSAAMQSRSDAERVDELLRQNSALIAMMADYKQELQAIKASLQKLERAYYGYSHQSAIAADGGIGIEIEEIKR